MMAMIQIDQGVVTSGVRGGQTARTAHAPIAHKIEGAPRETGTAIDVLNGTKTPSTDLIRGHPRIVPRTGREAAPVKDGLQESGGRVRKFLPLFPT